MGRRPPRLVDYQLALVQESQLFDSVTLALPVSFSSVCADGEQSPSPS
jgi:hypothetical protein